MPPTMEKLGEELAKLTMIHQPMQQYILMQHTNELSEQGEIGILKEQGEVLYFKKQREVVYFIKGQGELISTETRCNLACQW